MSHAKTRVAFPEAFKPKKFSAMDKDEKRFRAEDAARTMKRSNEIDRKIGDIKADPGLFKAANALLAQEAADIKKAQTI